LKRKKENYIFYSENRGFRFDLKNKLVGAILSYFLQVNELRKLDILTLKFEKAFRPLDHFAWQQNDYFDIRLA
jgi:hypothetical protein